MPRYTPFITVHQLGTRWLRHRRSFLTDHVVENTGSVARDILAAERTFLAWARTGLGFVGAGSALFAAYNADEVMVHRVQPACAILLVNGSFLLAFATRRYLTVIKAIREHNHFPIQVRGTLLAVGLTALGTASSIGLVASAKSEVLRAEKEEETGARKS